MRRWDRYLLLRRQLLGETGREAYERLIEEFAAQGVLWLDAGCGDFFFHNRDREQRIRRRIPVSFGCDRDLSALKASAPNVSIVQAALEAIPYRTSTFDLATMNYVAEHLADPLAVFREIERILKPGGHFILHTPNVHSYWTLGARLLPKPIKRAVALRLHGRSADHIYPAMYRANSPRRISSLLEAAGFKNIRIFIHATEATTAVMWPPLWVTELLLVRLTPRCWWTNILVVADKSA